MRLFSKRKKRGLSSRQEQTAGRIALAILGYQQRVADYLNGKTAGVSSKVWIILLVVFCAGFGLYCLSLLLQIL
jgi:predicted Zn-dependent protease with MMP-like domain